MENYIFTALLDMRIRYIPLSFEGIILGESIVPNTKLYFTL